MTPDDSAPLWTCLAHVEVQSGPVNEWFRAYARCFVQCGSEDVLFDTIGDRLRAEPIELWDEASESAKPTPTRLLAVDESERLTALMDRRELTPPESEAAAWALQSGFSLAELHSYPDDEDDGVE